MEGDRSTAVVLLYHRVTDIPEDPWNMSVTPVRFAEHLDVISREFVSLPLSELAAGVASHHVPSGGVAVTFDDGYRDNLETAVPLLERHGVPATIFVTTCYVGSGQDFWWDDLASLCRVEEYRDLHRQFQALPQAERIAQLDAMRGGERGRHGPPTTMSPEELRRLAASAVVEIGSHTVTHPALPALERREQLEELQSSKRQLEEYLGRPILGVSYPYGDFCAQTVECAAEAGFAFACTSGRRRVCARSDLFALPRYPVRDWAGDELLANLRDWLG